MHSDDDQNAGELYSRGYRRYALFLLMLVQTFSSLDRQILAVLTEPIKHDLGLADWQLGMLTGLAFAVFYTLLGIPIARRADHGDRVHIIVASLSVWSLCTVLCGFAVNFWTLVAARIGVGLGEAGGTPASYSLITGGTPPEKRGGAMAFYNMSLPLGAMLGMGMGGVVADAWGWRAALLVAGAPGLLLAALVFLTLREPRRAARAGGAPLAPRLSIGEVVNAFRGNRAFWWLVFGSTFSGLAYNGQNSFLASLLLRTHRPEVADLAAQFGVGPPAFTGLALGLIFGIFSGVGALLGGPLGDRLARTHISGYAKAPAIIFPIATPLFVCVGLAPSAILVLTVLAVAVLAQGLVLGPVAAAIQSAVRPATRAMAAAVQLLLTSLIGVGLGPLLTGMLSDVLSYQHGPIMGLRLAVATGGLFYGVGWFCFYRAYLVIRRSETFAGRPRRLLRSSEATP